MLPKPTPSKRTRNSTKKRKSRSKRHKVNALPAPCIAGCSPNTGRVILRERIRFDAITYATHRTNPLSLDANTQSRLLQLKATLKPDGNMHWYTRVEYTYAHQDEFQIGRLYAQPHSLQTMSKRIRSLLAHGVYRDVDIANAQPTITLHIAEQHGWPHRHLKHYVLNRDLQLQLFATTTKPQDSREPTQNKLFSRCSTAPHRTMWLSGTTCQRRCQHSVSICDRKQVKLFTSSVN